MVETPPLLVAVCGSLKSGEWGPCSCFWGRDGQGREAVPWAKDDLPETAPLLISVCESGWELLLCIVQGEGALESRLMVVAAAVAASVRGPISCRCVLALTREHEVERCPYICVSHEDGTGPSRRSGNLW